MRRVRGRYDDDHDHDDDNEYTKNEHLGAGPQPTDFVPRRTAHKNAYKKQYNKNATTGERRYYNLYTGKYTYVIIYNNNNIIILSVYGRRVIRSVGERRKSVGGEERARRIIIIYGAHFNIIIILYYYSTCARRCSSHFYLFVQRGVPFTYFMPEIIKNNNNKICYTHLLYFPFSNN